MQAKEGQAHTHFLMCMYMLPLPPVRHHHCQTPHTEKSTSGVSRQSVSRESQEDGRSSSASSSLASDRRRTPAATSGCVLVLTNRHSQRSAVSGAARGGRHALKSALVVDRHLCVALLAAGVDCEKSGGDYFLFVLY